MSRSPRLALEQMRDACAALLAYMADLDFAGFNQHGVYYDAILRQLLVLGEAATRVPESVRQQLPEIQFRQIVAFRNIVVHHYDAIDDEIVWDILKSKVSTLAPQLDAALDFLNGEPTGEV
jgi:uncharacterized protein with HEPN domain